MNKPQLFEFHKKFCKDMLVLCQNKNADYTGASDDPFFNFTRVEATDICSTEQGFLTRMTDKSSRLISFVKQGVLKVKDESVRDTLLDMANYCILMAAYIESKKKPTKVKPKKSKKPKKPKAKVDKGAPAK